MSEERFTETLGPGKGHGSILEEHQPVMCDYQWWRSTVYVSKIPAAAAAAIASWTAPARTGGTVRQGRRLGSSITVQITLLPGHSTLAGQDAVASRFSRAISLCDQDCGSGQACMPSSLELLRIMGKTSKSWLFWVLRQYVASHNVYVT